jgi:hypothetical protein
MNKPLVKVFKKSFENRIVLNAERLIMDSWKQEGNIVAVSGLMCALHYVEGARVVLGATHIGRELDLYLTDLETYLEFCIDGLLKR